MIITDEKVILGFLNGSGKDSMGRTIHEILSESDKTMEICHDAVQWVFPLAEVSKMALIYPLINPSLVEKAKNDPAILDNLRQAKDRFERFLGLGKYENLIKQSSWCIYKYGRPNHNLLRVTRIIRCLRIFGLDKEATEFFDRVLEVANRFALPKSTINYWIEAHEMNIWEPLQK